MFGIDSILQSHSQDSEDYYNLLGCGESADVHQIITEYRIRALKYHPDKNAGDEFALGKFQQLQEARDTLLDPEKKGKYDQWRRSGICMPYKQWLGLSSRCQMTMHWVNPKIGLMLEEAAPNDTDKEKNKPNVQKHTISNESPKHFTAETSNTRQCKPWSSDNCSTGIYGKFRNYQI